METSECSAQCKIGKLDPVIVKTVDELISEGQPYEAILLVLDAKVPTHGINKMNISRHKKHILRPVQAQQTLRNIDHFVKVLRTVEGPAEAARAVELLKSEVEYYLNVPEDKRTPVIKKHFLACMAELRLWVQLAHSVGVLEHYEPATLDWVKRKVSEIERDEKSEEKN